MLSVSVCVPFVCSAFYSHFNERYAALFSLFWKGFYCLWFREPNGRCRYLSGGSDLFAPLWGCELPHLRGCPRPFSARSTWAFFSKSGCLNLISCPLPYKWHFWWDCDYEFNLSRGSPWMDRCKWLLSSEARWPLGRGPVHPWQLPLVKFFAYFGSCAGIRRWGLWTLIKS